MSDRGEYRPIYTSLLHSGRFRDLSPNGRLLLFTVKLHLPPSGIGRVPAWEHAFSELTGLSPGDVREASHELVRLGWLDIDGTTLWLVDGLAYEPSLSAKSWKTRAFIGKLVAGLGNTLIAKEFREKYADWMPSPDTGAPKEPRKAPSMGPSKGSEGKGEGEGEGEGSIPKKNSENLMGLDGLAPPSLDEGPDPKPAKGPKDPLVRAVRAAWSRHFAGLTPPSRAEAGHLARLAAKLAVIGPKFGWRPEEMPECVDLVVRSYVADTMREGNYSPSPEWLEKRASTYLLDRRERPS